MTDSACSIDRCHNIYLVLPQFLVTALSSIIFALLAPHHSVLGHHTPAHHSASSDTGLVGGSDGGEENGFGDLGESDFGDDARHRTLVVRAVRVVGGAIGEAFAAKVRRQDEGEGEVELPLGGEAGWDALGLIFRCAQTPRSFSPCSSFLAEQPIDATSFSLSLSQRRRRRSGVLGLHLHTDVAGEPSRRATSEVGAEGLSADRLSALHYHCCLSVSS